MLVFMLSVSLGSIIGILIAHGIAYLIQLGIK